MTRFWACLIAFLEDLHASRTRRYNEQYIDTLPTEAPHLRQMVVETRRTRNIERPTEEQKVS